MTTADATLGTVKPSDITDDQVVQACIDWHGGPGDGWVTDLLVERTGATYEVVEAAMERADDRDLIDYGVSLRGAWATPEGKSLLTNG